VSGAPGAESGESPGGAYLEPGQIERTDPPHVPPELARRAAVGIRRVHAHARGIDAAVLGDDVADDVVRERGDDRLSLAREPLGEMGGAEQALLLAGVEGEDDR